MGHVTITYKGQLSVTAVEQSMRVLDDALRNAPEGVNLVVNCLAMEGYDAEARRAFQQSVGGRLGSLRHVAVITDRKLWPMIVATMSAMTRVPMRSFGDVQEAEVWFSQRN